MDRMENMKINFLNTVIYEVWYNELLELVTEITHYTKSDFLSTHDGGSGWILT